jgi:pSer/pThr/pTyr-binding forkhead associated (FHA) protein
MSNAGFTLMDKGSTNGTMVLGKRVQAHELVDNDVFTLGKTDFKFKSIN